jgi:predicted short-subunit dehydrogenase-like oxidoreductase (DUF2520 family)
MRRIRIVGAGRAGTALARALRKVGHHVEGPVTRGASLSDATDGVEVLILATPDRTIADVASKVTPSPDCVVLHLSGSLGVDVLASHPRRAAMHPLVPLPTAELGAARLASGVTFAVAGDVVAAELAHSLGGTTVEVADEDRALYHAAASVAANHVVALLGQVERLAAHAGLPVDAFVELARCAVEDVAVLGPKSALTGPAARGDWVTVERHLDALPEAERAGYRAGVGLVLELAASAPLVPELELDEPVDERPEVRAPSVALPA